MALVKQIAPSYADINLTDIRGKSILHYVVRKSESVQLVEHLLGVQSINVNLQDINGKTALHYASMVAQKHGIVKVLSASIDVDVNILDNSKKTALHHALSIEGNDKTVKILLDRQEIEVHHVDETGKTILHHCSILGYDTEIADQILKHGHGCKWIQNVDQNGKTAFGYAVMYKHEHISQLITARTGFTGRL